MTVRCAMAALGLSAVLALSLTACGGQDASVTACDDFSDAYTQLTEDVTAAGQDQGAVEDAYTATAGTLDDLAATDGVDAELAAQIEAGADAARAEAAGESDDVTEPDRTLRATFDVCDGLRG